MVYTYEDVTALRIGYSLDDMNAEMVPYEILKGS
jgi:hypothetical protein